MTRRAAKVTTLSRRACGKIPSMTRLALILALVALVAVPSFAQDRARGRRYRKADIEQTIKRLEENTDRFKKTVDRELDRSVLNGTRAEDRINDRVSDFEKATDRLRDRFDRSDDWMDTRRDVENVLSEGRRIEGLFDRVRAYSRVRSQWNAVKHDANTLARYYELPPLR